MTFLPINFGGIGYNETYFANSRNDCPVGENPLPFLLLLLAKLVLKKANYTSGKQNDAKFLKINYTWFFLANGASSSSSYFL